MPKETAADRKLREAREREEAEKKAAEYAVKLPAILLRYIAWAQSRHDVEVKVKYHDQVPGGSTVTFKFAAKENAFFQREIAIEPTTEEWEVQELQKAFEDLEAQDAERARKHALAKAAYEKLSPEEREALGVKVP